MIGKQVNERLQKLRNEVATQTIKLGELLVKYKEVDFGDYFPYVAYDGRLLLSISESNLSKAIRFFKSQLNKSGKVADVFPCSDVFTVYYNFDEDFILHFQTASPEKYLGKDCEIVEKTITSKKVVCKRS